MAKEKGKGARGVPNKHLHARVAYLQQAAKYLTLRSCASNGVDHGTTPITGHDNTLQLQESNQAPKIPPGTPAITRDHVSGLPTYLSSHLRQVALKAQIRLNPSVKRSICKTCNTVQIEGETCSKYTENLSHNGRKPHAEMLVLECLACGTKKRFPTAAVRQRKKDERKQPTLGSPAAKSREAIIHSPKGPPNAR